jgi:hypothetical protein
MMSDELRQAAMVSMRAAEALAEDARHSSAAAVEWVQALNQAAQDTLKWAQEAQTVEALEAAAAMEVAVEEAVQAVQQLLAAQAGTSAQTSAGPQETSP